MKTLSVILVRGYREQCAFVSLNLDRILQQHVPRNTVAKFYPKCFLLSVALKNFESNDIIGLLPSLKRNLSVLANETLSVSLCRENMF